MLKVGILAPQPLEALEHGKPAAPQIHVVQQSRIALRISKLLYIRHSNIISSVFSSQNLSPIRVDILYGIGAGRAIRPS
jgi:hypothetical protein